jgi:hypothetical protein
MAAIDAAQGAFAEAEEIDRAGMPALARKYAQYAFQALVTVAMTAKSETARVIAAKELLDRGYGKVPEAPPEAVEAPSQSGHRPVLDLEDFRRIDRP